MIVLPLRRFIDSLFPSQKPTLGHYRILAEFPDIKVHPGALARHLLACVRRFGKGCVGPKWKLAALANRFRLSTEGIDPRLGRAD